MAEVQHDPPPVPESFDNPPQPPSAPVDDPPPPSPDPTPPPVPTPPRFDPSRMIGIIRRKALIKDLAAVYHAECLTHCQELLEFQRKCEEAYIGIKDLDESKKGTMWPAKRLKKSR